MFEPIRRRLRDVGSPDRIGVAVSGGADSVFLLRALHYLGVAAAVLHVNHRLRGAESDADQAFVASLAAELGMPFHCVDSPLPEGNTEQEARRARYQFFNAIRAEHALDAVATGHTLDDQAETVLLRFLRGSGTQGLAGILPVTGEHIIRPLLDFRRANIRHWLQTQEIAWREDASNESTGFDRNRARKETLPALERDYNPSLAVTLASTAEWARGEEDYWATETNRLGSEILHVHGETVSFRNGPMLALPMAAQRRLLRRAVSLVRGSLRGIDFQHIEAVRGLLSIEQGSGRIHLPGVEAYRSFDQFRLAPLDLDARLPRNFQKELETPGHTPVPEHGITIVMELVSANRVYNEQRDMLDPAVCPSPLWVRNWRPGDSYWRKGGTGVQKIKQLFQEFRIPLWERRTWPVVVWGDPAGETPEGLIVWTRRFGVAEQFAARPGSAQALLLREMGESNEVAPASKDQVALRGLPITPAEPGAEVL